MGSNAEAHNLALGLLLAWLPTLILCCIVDRNPISADAIRSKLNKLVDAVRVALLNPELRGTYIRDTGRPQQQFAWTKILSDEDYFRQDFFTRFAGQGRVRWHYGVAHSILAGIEESYLSKHGRDWLRDAEAARTSLVKGPPGLKGLHWFDFREFWQVLAAFIIVIASIGGAFILSYFTPTVGLGCRSGGYLVYTVSSIGIFMIEGLCWLIVPEGSSSDDDPVTRLGNRLDRRLSRSIERNWIVAARTSLRRLLWWWRSLTTRDRFDVLLLRPLEVANSVWLCYIVLAQTFGAYKTCNCQCSMWGSNGGYMDFENVEYYRARGVIVYWSVGTALSTSVMLLAFVFIIMEWSTQSHLSTEDYDSARKGLERTRQFKKHTTYIRNLPGNMSRITKSCWRKCFKRRTTTSNSRQDFVWTAYTASNRTTSPQIPVISGGHPDPRTYDRAFPDDEGTSSILRINYDLESDYMLQPVSPGVTSHTRSPRSSFGQYDGEQHVLRTFLSP